MVSLISTPTLAERSPLQQPPPQGWTMGALGVKLVWRKEQQRKDHEMNGVVNFCDKSQNQKNHKNKKYITKSHRNKLKNPTK